MPKRVKNQASSASEAKTKEIERSNTRTLPPRIAMAALLGHQLGEAVITWGVPYKENPELGLSGDTGRQLRVGRAEAVAVLANRFRFTQSGDLHLRRLLDRIREDAPLDDIAMEAREVVRRLTAELQAMEGHSAGVAFAGSYHLRELAIVTDAVNTRNSKALVEFFGQEQTRNILAYGLVNIQACLSASHSGSPVHQTVTEFMGDIDLVHQSMGNFEQSCNDPKRLRRLIVCLKEEARIWFEDYIEYIEPDGKEIVSTPETLDAAFAFGYHTSLLHHTCLLYPASALQLFAHNFYIASALARALGIPDHEDIQKAELAVQQFSDGLKVGQTPSRDEVMVAGELIRHGWRYRTSALVEIAFGTFAKRLFSLGEQCGRIAVMLSTTMQDAPVLMHLMVLQPEVVAKDYDLLIKGIRAAKLPPTTERRLVGAVFSMKGSDPLQLQVNGIWQTVTSDIRSALKSVYSAPVLPPCFVHLAASVSRIRREYPDYERNVFVMMTFADSPQHAKIFDTTRATLENLGYHALRADERLYSDDLWSNVCVYMLACKRGIAIFERITVHEFNPSVAMEVGFMLALGKEVLLLKDIGMPALPTDLVGKLYRPFSALDPSGVRTQVDAWVQELA